MLDNGKTAGLFCGRYKDVGLAFFLQALRTRSLWFHDLFAEWEWELTFQFGVGISCVPPGREALFFCRFWVAFCVRLSSLGSVLLFFGRILMQRSYS